MNIAYMDFEETDDINKFESLMKDKIFLALEESARGIHINCPFKKLDPKKINAIEKVIKEAEEKFHSKKNNNKIIFSIVKNISFDLEKTVDSLHTENAHGPVFFIHHFPEEEKTLGDMLEYLKGTSVGELKSNPIKCACISSCPRINGNIIVMCNSIKDENGNEIFQKYTFEQGK